MYALCGTYVPVVSTGYALGTVPERSAPPVRETCCSSVRWRSSVALYAFDAEVSSCVYASGEDGFEMSRWCAVDEDSAVGFCFREEFFSSRGVELAHVEK